MTTATDDTFVDHLCGFCGETFDDENDLDPPVRLEDDEEGPVWAHTSCATTAGAIKPAEEHKPTFLESLAEELDLDVATVRKGFRRLVELMADPELDEAELPSFPDVNPYSRPAPCDVCGMPGRFRGMDTKGEDVVDLALCDQHAEERGDAK